MNTCKTEPPRILPDSFRGHEPASLLEAALANWRMIERGHFDAARFLAHVWEQPRCYGYSSAIDFAEAEWHIQSRQAYFLLQVERDTRDLPHLRKAWADGSATISNVREVAKVATPEDDAEWADLAVRLPYRAVYARVHGKPEAAAAEGKRPWPDTKLTGEIGRPDPHHQVPRPITGALAELEKRVFEKHNRAAGQDTRWGEFFEAMLVLYEHELDRMERAVPEDVRRVLAHARYRCQVPHCTRRAELELHHSVHKSQGGDDNPRFLAVTCRYHHAAHHQGLLEIEGDAGRGFRFRHRDTPGGRWQEFPEGGDFAYDPLERAWDGPSYLRESPDHAYGSARAIKNRRSMQRSAPIGLRDGFHAALE